MKIYLCRKISHQKIKNNEGQDAEDKGKNRYAIKKHRPYKRRGHVKERSNVFCMQAFLIWKLPLLSSTKEERWDGTSKRGKVVSKEEFSLILSLPAYSNVMFLRVCVCVCFVCPSLYSLTIYTVFIRMFCVKYLVLLNLISTSVTPANKLFS